jgi:hypothetical protein
VQCPHKPGHWPGFVLDGGPQPVITQVLPP